MPIYRSLIHVRSHTHVSCCCYLPFKIVCANFFFDHFLRAVIIILWCTPCRFSNKFVEYIGSDTCRFSTCFSAANAIRLLNEYCTDLIENGYARNINTKIQHILRVLILHRNYTLCKIVLSNHNLKSHCFQIRTIINRTQKLFIQENLTEVTL